VSSYVRNPSRMSVRLLVILILIFNQECTSTPSSAIWHTSTKHTSLLRPPCTASTRQNWLCNITRELYGLTLKSPNSSHQSAFISQQVISMASSSRSYLESKIPDHPVLKDCENGTNMLPVSRYHVPCPYAVWARYISAFVRCRNSGSASSSSNHLITVIVVENETGDLHFTIRTASSGRQRSVR
jgi:hypothetical protein